MCVLCTFISRQREEQNQNNTKRTLPTSWYGPLFVISFCSSLTSTATVKRENVSSVRIAQVRIQRPNAMMSQPISRCGKPSWRCASVPNVVAHSCCGSALIKEVVVRKKTRASDRHSAKMVS
jgi:hypothetical protein